MDKEKNRKYRDIMDTSKDLFWKHGFRRVSVEEICKKAKVSKMTYYRFFSNKFENAKAVFDNIINDGFKTWNEIIEADTTGHKKIEQIIMFKMDKTREISKEFLQDFYFGSQPELKEYVENKISEIWKNIIEDFRRAQIKGFFRNDFKPEFLFHVTIKFIEIMSDEALMKLYNSPQDLIAEFVNFFAYGISNRDKD